MKPTHKRRFVEDDIQARESLNPKEKAIEYLMEVQGDYDVKESHSIDIAIKAERERIINIIKKCGLNKATGILSQKYMIKKIEQSLKEE